MTDNKDSLPGSQPDGAEQKPEAEAMPEAPASPAKSKKPAAKVADKPKADKPEPPIIKPQAKPKKIKTGRPVAWLALLLALGSVAATGYLYWQQQMSPQPVVTADSSAELEQLQSELDRNMSVLTAELDRVSARQVEQAAADQSLDEKLEQLAAQNASLALQIGDISQVSRRSWMLAEAEYLLRLANQRVALQGELDSVASMLTAADNIMREVDDFRLVPVRAALAEELTAIRAIEPIDVEGIYLQLAALSRQAGSLELLQPETEEVEAAITASDASAVSAWDSVLSTLGKLVQIRHRDEPVEPLLSPQQHFYVQQNVRLMLEQAQLALLQRRQALYDASLAKASAWVERYFKLNNSRQAVVTGLDELQNLQIDPELPDISGSLQELKRYLNQVADELASGQAAGKDGS